MTFSLLTLYVADMNASLTFYRDLMGMRVTRRIDRPGGGIVFLDGGSGGVQLELIADAEQAGAGCRGFSIGFDVADIDRAIQALEAQGIKKLRGPIAAGGTTQLAFFEGPGGETVELVCH